MASPSTHHISPSGDVESINDKWWRKPLVRERSINIRKFNNYQASYMERWESFMIPMEVYINETVVREFYTSLEFLCQNHATDENIQYVQVRGRLVPLTEDAINQAFRLPEDHRRHYEEVWDEYGNGNYNHILQEVNDEWFYQLQGRAATFRDLNTERKELKKFINNRVLYSETPNIITEDELILMYAVEQHLAVNWGRLIRRHLLQLFRRPQFPSQIPYSYLISRLCTENADTPGKPYDRIRRSALNSPIISII